MIGELILQRARYAVRLLDEIEGVCVTFPAGLINEFVVNFDESGETGAQINDVLRAKGIFGGKDLSGDFPELGQSALYCVTEIHTLSDIERLACALDEVIAK